MPLPTIGPPPRTLRRRISPSLLGNGCILLLLGMFMIGGMAILGVFAGKLAMGLVGERTDAQLVEKSTSRSSKGRITYKVHFSFQSGGKTVEGNSSISKERWLELPERGWLPIVYLPVAPTWFADYVEPDSRFPAGTWITLLIVIIFVPVILLFYFAVVIEPRRKKQLVIHGAETEGEVIGKRTRRGAKGGTFYDIDVSFTLNGEQFTGKETVTQGVYNKYDPGDAVKIAYDPQKPSRFVAVCLSDWEVELEGGVRAD